MQNNALQLALGLKFRSPGYVFMWLLEEAKWEIICSVGVDRPKQFKM